MGNGTGRMLTPTAWRSFNPSGKPPKSRGKIYSEGERVEYSDGTVMVADAKGTLRRVQR